MTTPIPTCPTCTTMLQQITTAIATTAARASASAFYCPACRKDVPTTTIRWCAWPRGDR